MTAEPLTQAKVWPQAACARAWSAHAPGVKRPVPHWLRPWTFPGSSEISYLSFESQCLKSYLIAGSGFSLIVGHLARLMPLFKVPCNHTPLTGCNEWLNAPLFSPLCCFWGCWRSEKSLIAWAIMRGWGVRTPSQVQLLVGVRCWSLKRSRFHGRDQTEATCATSNKVMLKLRLWTPALKIAFQKMNHGKRKGKKKLPCDPLGTSNPLHKEQLQAWTLCDCSFIHLHLTKHLSTQKPVPAGRWQVNFKVG